jgi:anti-sigma28 factor (negative regulator of flagellin synthesis)
MDPDRPADATRTEGAPDSVGGNRADRSADAMLAAAVVAAQSLPDVRADRVAHAKKRLANGLIGGDAGRLAVSIIDSLLEK